MSTITESFNGISLGDAGNTRPLAMRLFRSGDIEGFTGSRADRDDYFSFTAATSGIASFGLTGLSADLDLRLLDSPGHPPGQLRDISTGDENVAFSVTAGQTYYVHVDPWAEATSHYTLKADLPQRPAANPTIAEWTIMVYLAADNNLEHNAILDLNEMESVILPPSLRVATLIDRIPGYDSSNGDWTGTMRGLITHDTLPRQVSSFADFEDLGEEDTGIPATLTEFIDWAASAAPAKNYGLIIWDHGGGLSGAAWDETNDDHNLSMSEITLALEESSVEHFGFVGFDACQMGLLEQMWALKDLTDVVVSSQENVPGNGSPYDIWLNVMTENPKMSAADIASAMVTAYGVEYEEDLDWVTFSAVYTDALDDIHTALEAFISTALSASGTDWIVLRAAAEETFSFPYNRETSKYGDLGEFMSLTAARTTNPTLASTANAVEAALDAAVFAQTGAAEASGLSIYLPHGDQSVSETYIADDFAFLGVSNWDEFLNILV